MRVGVFGGTFDPIHRGHVESVLGVKTRLSLDRALVVPTARPPHKDGPRGASALHRFAMVELALLDEPDLLVRALEMDSNRPAYTVDTLERLRAQQPEHEYVLIVGADSFVQLSTWRNWRRILELSKLAVMVRPGWNLAAQERSFPAEQTRAIEVGRVHFVENEPIDLSSSEIRRNLRLGEPPPGDSLHPRVLQYASKYGLYRDLPGAPNP